MLSFAEFRDLISNRFGTETIVAVSETGLQPHLSIATEQIADVCRFLHGDERCYFDFLNCLSGVDNGPEAGTMEVWYHLSSLPFGHRLTLKVTLPRNAPGEPLPEVPTVSSVWRTADWHEREAFDLVGIRFSGHPDLRRILCPADWEGHPLRRDYREQEYYHGLRVPFDQHNQQNGFRGEKAAFTDQPDAAIGKVSSSSEAVSAEKETPAFSTATAPTTFSASTPKTEFVAKTTLQQTNEFLKLSEPLVTNPATLSSELMLINMGPQHPAMHGVLRLEVITDGEVVADVIPHVGYLHRCFEKHAENKAFHQTIPFVDRLDYLAAMNSEHVWAMGVEKMLGITDQIPKRVEYIRVLVAELNRIASHFVAIGTYAIDIGAFTPFLWLMRDREHIQRLLEWVSGARMLYNYIWVGGLYYDLPLGFEERCREFASYLQPKLDELDRLFITNQIFIERAANVGVLPLEVAINYGCSGPMLRGSGLRWDLRRVDGYSVYPELEFHIPIGEGKAGSVGDCWDRNWVRAAECRESLKIITQCLDQLTGTYKRTRDFDPQAAVPKKLRPPQQDTYVRGETPRGELGFFFRATGKSDVPYRCSARSPCFSNLSVVHEISKGAMVSDLIAIVGSVDIVMGELDR